MDSPKYFDQRSDFFSAYFERALHYDEYLAGADEKYAHKWREFESKLKLEKNQQETIASFKRRINLLVLSGVWCGDCARQGPMLNLIASVNPLVDLRFLESRTHPELQNELRVIGASRVPVVTGLSEDFFELGRYGDRTLTAYRRKARTELGPACDAGLVAPDAQELSAEVGDWLREIERWQLILRLSPALRERYGD